MTNKKTWFHGEVTIFQIESLPSGIKKVENKDDKYILADSETTGNHHCLEKKAGIELYERDGVLYMKNTVPANVFCVDVKRHDTITLEPGIYEIDKAKEYDYLTEETRNVAD